MVPREKIKWHHVASDAETMRAVRDHSSTVIEVPMIDQTFIISDHHMTIVRCGALGGDHREIYGGWVYHSLMGFLSDKHEILYMSRNPINRVV